MRVRVRVCACVVCSCLPPTSIHVSQHRSFSGGRGGAGAETPDAAATAASARGRTRKRKRGEGSVESGGTIPALAQQQQGEGKGTEENVFGTGKIHEIRSAPACWHMRGRLTNAATGQTIALVEGVELARSLTFETANSRKLLADRRNRGSRSGNGVIVGRVGAAASAAAAGGGPEAEEELEVDRVLKTGMWTAFGALASSKFFMYQVRNDFWCVSFLLSACFRRTAPENFPLPL